MAVNEDASSAEGGDAVDRRPAAANAGGPTRGSFPLTYQANGGVGRKGGGAAVNGGGDGFRKEIRDLEELLSKLNPMAEEFVPPSLSNAKSYCNGFYSYYGNVGVDYGNGAALQLQGGRCNGGFARKVTFFFLKFKRYFWGLILLILVLIRREG